MGGFVTVARADDIPEGEARAFDVDGTMIAVARVGDAWYAIDDTCSHQRCSLSEGEIDGGILVCPCHGSEFALSSGEVMNGPADEPVRAYEVRVEDGEVRIRP